MKTKEENIPKTKEELIQQKREEQAKIMAQYKKPEPMSEKQQYLLEKMGIRLRAKKN